MSAVEHLSCLYRALIPGIVCLFHILKQELYVQIVTQSGFINSGRILKKIYSFIYSEIVSYYVAPTSLALVM